MFEPPGTPTIAGLTAGEWEALAEGFSDGFKAGILKDFPKCPDAQVPEKHYYDTAAIAGNLFKILVIIEIINYAGVAIFTGGFI